jgi:hypothetical protein
MVLAPGLGGRENDPRSTRHDLLLHLSFSLSQPLSLSLPLALRSNSRSLYPSSPHPALPPPTQAAPSCVTSHTRLLSAQIIRVRVEWDSI